MLQISKKFNLSVKALLAIGTMIFLTGAGPCNWINKMKDCSDCKTHASSEHKNEGSSKADVCETGYRLTSTPVKGSSEPLAKFKKSVKTRLTIDIDIPTELTKETIETSLRAMIGSMDFDLNQMPKQQRDMIVGDIVKTKSMLIANIENMLANDDAFKKRLYSSFMGLLEMTIFQHIAEATEKNIAVSKSEVNEEFEKNRSRYVEKLGGTRTLGVKFVNQEAAETFVTTLDELDSLSESIFTENAKNSGGQFKDFGWVSAEFARGIPQSILDAVKKKVSLPRLEIIADDNSDGYWAIALIESRETTYMSAEDRTPRIETAIRRRQLMDKMNKLTEEAVNKVGVEMLTPNNKNGNESMMPSDISDEEFSDEDLEEMAYAEENVNNNNAGQQEVALV